MGLPVITSNTKSYSRVMHKIHQDYSCNTPDEWRDKIIKLAESQKYRANYIKSASSYINEYCSTEAIFNTWEYIFFSK